MIDGLVPVPGRPVRVLYGSGKPLPAVANGAAESLEGVGVRVRMGPERRAGVMEPGILGAQMARFTPVDPAQVDDPSLSRPDRKRGQLRFALPLLRQEFLELLLGGKVGAVVVLPDLPEEEEEDQQAQSDERGLHGLPLPRDGEPVNAGATSPRASTGASSVPSCTLPRGSARPPPR